MSAESVLTHVVVDVSVAVKWIVAEENTSAAVALRDQWTADKTLLCAPDFLLIELHNILWKKLLRGLLSADDPLVAQGPTFGLTLNWSSSQPLLSIAFLLAIQYKITIYDALYAALAQSLGAPLYTADQTLISKLQGMSIPVRAIS